MQSQFKIEINEYYNSYTVQSSLHQDIGCLFSYHISFKENILNKKNSTCPYLRSFKKQKGSVSSSEESGLLKQNNFSFRSWLLTWMLWYWYMLLSHEAMVLIRGVVVSFGPTRGQCETFQLGFYYPSQPNSDCKEPSQISLVGSKSPRIWLTKCSIDTSWKCVKLLALRTSFC